MFKCKTVILTIIIAFSLLSSTVSLANKRIYSTNNDLDVKEFFDGVLDGTINSSETMDNGQTALFFPAIAGNVDMVKQLLDHGVDPNIENNEHITALSCASLVMSMEGMKKMSQESPPEWVKRMRDVGGNRHLEVVELLLQKDPTLDNMGMALTTAKLRGQEAIAEKILILFKRKLVSLPPDQLSAILDQVKTLTDNPKFMAELRQTLDNKVEL